MRLQRVSQEGPRTPAEKHLVGRHLRQTPSFNWKQNEEYL
jgi:hypothetical protein